MFSKNNVKKNQKQVLPKKRGPLKWLEFFGSNVLFSLEIYTCIYDVWSIYLK